MSIFGNEAKLSSFTVGETGTNVTTIAFGHRSGKVLAAGDEYGTIHIYLIGQMTSLRKLQCETTTITTLRFSNEEDLLACGSRSGLVEICDLGSQKIISSGSHKTCIRSMEFFPSSNNFLATGSVDGTAKLWDPRRQGFIFNYKGHNGAINALKFSPDGRYLITASDDAAIRLWDVTAGKVIKAFEEHQGPVLTIQYHPKELLFASAGADRQIKFWDLEKLQFICETEMETSAIKCIAFEPIDANYILSGSNDTLCVHSWEPIQLLDTVQMNWKNVMDMMIHKDQLFGASVLENKVYIGSINLSNLKTKRRVSPASDYFPSTPKASSIARSAQSNKHSQRQPIIVKVENVKMQPEPSKAVESRPSTADSVMIDNQSALELNGPKQSSNRQPVSAQPSTAAKFASQSSSKVEVTVPIKPKTSQSVVQVDAFEHPRTNEQIFANLSKGHHTLNSQQRNRTNNLILLINLSRTNPPKTNFQAIIASHDLSLECFCLRFVNDKLTKSDWNLDLCTLILPAVRDLVKCHYHWYNLTACQTLEKILTNFGRIIYDNIGAKSIGVDLSQQARREKCQICHSTLHEIRCLIQDRSKNLVDSALKQLFDTNLRLFNTYERS